MDGLQKISEEIIRLYRQQLNVWVLGYIGKLKGAELRQYNSRQERLEELAKELGRMIQAREASGSKIELGGGYCSQFRLRARRGIARRTKHCACASSRATVAAIMAHPLQWPEGVALVKTELSIGLTFSGIALDSNDPQKTARNTANARKAYDTALLLVHKLALAAAEKSETDVSFARLKAELAKLGENI